MSLYIAQHEVHGKWQELVPCGHFRNCGFGMSAMVSLRETVFFHVIYYLDKLFVKEVYCLKLDCSQYSMTFDICTIVCWNWIGEVEVACAMGVGLSDSMLSDYSVRTIWLITKDYKNKSDSQWQWCFFIINCVALAQRKHWRKEGYLSPFSQVKKAQKSFKTRVLHLRLYRPVLAC